MESTETDSEPDRLILLGDPDGDQGGDPQPPIGAESERKERRILRPLLIEP